MARPCSGRPTGRARTVPRSSSSSSTAAVTLGRGREPKSQFLGKSTKNISANDLMWEFFKRHPMPTPKPTGTKTSFKGWELYVWQKDGDTYFSLLEGTNRLKTDDEIAQGGGQGDRRYQSRSWTN